MLPLCPTCPAAECTITPAPADSLAAGASASTALRRKACKDVTSGEGRAHWQLFCNSSLRCLCSIDPCGGLAVGAGGQAVLAALTPVRAMFCCVCSRQLAPHCGQQAAVDVAGAQPGGNGAQGLAGGAASRWGRADCLAAARSDASPLMPVERCMLVGSGLFPCPCPESAVPACPPLPWTVTVTACLPAWLQRWMWRWTTRPRRRTRC